MTTTLKKATLAYNAILELMNERMSFKNAHTLFVTKQKLEPHAKFYSEEELKLVDKYANKDEKGQVIFNNNQFNLTRDKVEIYKKEHDALDSVEVTIEIEDNKLLGLTEIKPSSLEALSELFEFE